MPLDIIASADYPAAKVDHVEPVKVGGVDAVDTLVAPCRKCNG